MYIIVFISQLDIKTKGASEHSADTELVEGDLVKFSNIYYWIGEDSNLVRTQNIVFEISLEEGTTIRLISSRQMRRVQPAKP